MGGGILPIAIKNNNIYFLFGRESIFDDSRGYSDFGGGCDPGETNKDTAIREGAEELHGFLGNKSEFKNIITKKNSYLIKNEHYSAYLVLIDYDEKLPLYYNNHYEFLFNHFGKKMMYQIYKKYHVFEKQHVDWFSEKDLKGKKHLFRKWYRYLLDINKKEKKNIIKFFKNKKSKLNTKRNKTRISRKTKKKTKKRNNIRLVIKEKI